MYSVEYCMSRNIGIHLLTICILTLLLSCDYGHKPYRQASEEQVPGTTPLVVEVDDYGRFWNSASAQATLKAIEAASLDKNTVVMLFIHGWHHNAAEEDKNYKNFRTSLEQLQARLREPAYKEARVRLKLQEEIQVIGLYVGWRGKSLPWVFDYASFWTRKSAAERVGEGDLREYLSKLQKLYIKRNEKKNGDGPTFMGLVTVGHSFGGQVLFKAVSGSLERDLIDALSRSIPDPDANKMRLEEIVSGFGDLTVLLNPALEAFQYERIDRLTRSAVFTDRQTPVLLTVSAEDDSARKYWFWIGRNLNMFFRPTFPDNVGKELWTTALGEYAPQQTHTLEKAKADPARPPMIANAMYDDCTIKQVDFSAPLVLSEAELQPKPQRLQPYSPVVVAYTSNQLVQEHSGIFGETFSEFLTDYVANVEAKRLCLIREAHLSQVSRTGL